MQELGSDQVAFGYLTATVTVLDADPAVAAKAAEVYVRRMYSAHDMYKFDVAAVDGGVESIVIFKADGKRASIRELVLPRDVHVYVDWPAPTTPKSKVRRPSERPPPCE